MDTFEIILALAERFGLMVGVVFLVMTVTPVQRMDFTRVESRSRTLMIMLLFGLFGILGTYTGNSVFQSVANLRAMVVITGGLFGGPVVGLGAGVIAGAHRILMDLSGFSAWPCGIATALEGLAAGLVGMWLRDRAMNWRIAASLAIAGEAVHMGLILILSRPFDEAVELVRLIAPPMLLVNSVGAALFVEVINIFSRDRERRESLHAQLILDIANMSVSYLRSGLSRQSAEQPPRSSTTAWAWRLWPSPTQRTCWPMSGPGRTTIWPGEKSAPAPPARCSARAGRSSCTAPRPSAATMTTAP